MVCGWRDLTGADHLRESEGTRGGVGAAPLLCQGFDMELVLRTISGDRTVVVEAGVEQELAKTKLYFLGELRRLTVAAPEPLQPFWR